MLENGNDFALGGTHDTTLIPTFWREKGAKTLVEYTLRGNVLAWKADGIA
jgi:hypothetical protein